MNTDHHAGDRECLSPETVMELLDGQLDDRSAASARSHLQVCRQCQELSHRLTATAAAVKTQLGCLDDERMAAYVDYRAGRMRGTLSRAEIAGVRRHLAQCRRCREEVAMLTRDSRLGFSIFDRVRSLLTRVATVPAAQPRALRLAAVAVAGAAAVALVWAGLRPAWQRGAPPGNQVASRPGDSSPDHPVPPGEVEPPGVRPSTGAGTGSPARIPGSGARPGNASGERAPGVGAGPLSPSQTALVPSEGDTKAAIEQAQSELSLATQRADDNGQALAAAKLGSLYHKAGDYRAAARYYRQSASAAERAGKPELRIDFLILLGAVQAEQGDTAGARQQLQSALQLSRQIGYANGERNALVQLQLLDEPQGES